MKRISLVSFLFLAFVTIALAGCGGGLGGGNSAWVFPPEDTGAELPPSPLGEQLGPPVPVTLEGQQAAAAAAASDSAVQQDVPAEGETALPAPVAAPKNVKVALLVPLSGEHKALGQAMMQAAELALFDIGYTGFKLLPRDTRGTPEGAASATKSAIAEGAKLILGPVFSAEVAAAKPIAAQSGVNVIGFSTDWTQAGGNTFIMGFLPFDQIDRLVQFISKRRTGQGRIGIIAPQTDYGRVVSSAYQRSAEQFGIRGAQTTYFPPQSSDLSPIVRDFADYSGPSSAPPYDAVLMATGGGTASAISDLMAEYNMPPQKVKRLGTGLFDDDSLAVTPSMSGAWFAAPSPDLRYGYEKRFQSLYGTSPPRLSTLAYDATALAAVLAQRGVQKDGSPDFSRAAIMNPNGFAGIDGIFRFRSNGTVERGLAVLEYRGTRIKVIDKAPDTFQKDTQLTR